MFKELLNTVLFYECAHRKWMVVVRFLWSAMMCISKLTELTYATFKFILKMHWTLLKVIQIIAVANNKCIHVSRGEILVWKLQGKTYISRD